MKNIRIFLSENFHVLVGKISVYLNRHVFVMALKVGRRDGEQIMTKQTPHMNPPKHKKKKNTCNRKIALDGSVRKLPVGSGWGAEGGGGAGGGE